MTEQERETWDAIVANASPANAYLLEDDDAVTAAILAADVALKAKDAQLCRAKEAFKAVRDSTWGGNTELKTLVVKLGPMHELQAALSSTGPCAHELELKKLKGGG